jgi:hypothetical protein
MALWLILSTALVLVALVGYVAIGGRPRSVRSERALVVGFASVGLMLVTPAVVGGLAGSYGATTAGGLIALITMVGFAALLAARLRSRMARGSRKPSPIPRDHSVL